MGINRAIWFFFFLNGALMVGMFAVGINGWAEAIAIPGTEALCRGTLVGNVPITRAPLCFAVWFTEAKTWIVFTYDTVLHVFRGLYMHELLRTADIALYTIGALSFAFAAACLWADVMTRVVITSVSAWYTLLRGATHMLHASRAGRTA